MRIAVLAERRADESRVAATPDSVKALIKAGASVVVEKGAGADAFFLDAAYEDAGAELATRAAALKSADALYCVRRPDADTIAKLKNGAVLIGLLEPHGDVEFAKACAAAKVDALAMEFTPRITRAQAMDALSSQSNLAGYRAVIEGVTLYGRAFPMMMTAAGTIAAAKCFVMGAGVAGLQAIATARRLGAVVSQDASSGGVGDAERVSTVVLHSRLLGSGAGADPSQAASRSSMWLRMRSNSSVCLSGV